MTAPLSTHPLTQSERSDRACRHYWLIRHGLGLEPAGRSGEYIDAGTLWHHAMDAWWRGGDLAGAEEAIRREHARIVDSREWYRTADGEAYAEEMLRACLDTLPMYHEDHLAEAHDIDLVEVEVELTAELRGPRGGSTDRWIRGKLDKVVRYRPTGELWLVDHKTRSSAITDADVDRYQYSPQASHYALLWALCRPVMGPIVGIVHDIVHLSPVLRGDDWPRLKAGGLSKVVPAGAMPVSLREALSGASETPEWYDEAMARLDARRRAVTCREWLRLLPHELERTRAELYGECDRVRSDRSRLPERPPVSPDDIADLLRSVGPHYARTPSQCWSRGRRCPYMAVCRDPSPETASALVVAPSRYAATTPAPVVQDDYLPF